MPGTERGVWYLVPEERFGARYGSVATTDRAPWPLDYDQSSMSATQPLRVAVVGSGPAGFYAAGALLAARRRRGGYVRTAAHAVGAGAARRRARPPQDQIGLTGVREDRRAARLPLLRQRRVRPRRHARRSARPLPRGICTVGAQIDRRLGIPGEDLPGSSRPPSSWPGTTAIPTTATASSTSQPSGWWWSASATSRSTWRACWPDAGGAREDRHCRPRARRDRGAADQGDRGAGPARPGAGRVHHPGAAGAG